MVFKRLGAVICPAPLVMCALRKRLKARKNAKPMTNKQKKPNFEEAIHELEALVNALESGDVPLEESLAVFEKGIKLTRECQQHLNTAEQKVQQLIGDGDDMQLVDFEE